MAKVVGHLPLASQNVFLEYAPGGWGGGGDEGSVIYNLT